MDEKCHPEGQSVTDVSLARDWADILEEKEVRRSLVSRSEARAIVARKTGVPEGKLYSLRRNRIKDIGRVFLNRLGASVIRELQLELARVEHDLGIINQIGGHTDDGETLSLLASRQKIREALGLDSDLPDGGGS